MSFSTFISSLKQRLSSQTVILEDSSTDDFKEVLKRWSNKDVLVPAAILRPATREDAVSIVRLAHENSIPFVPASGGHSPWSTIDHSGFILDLGLLNSIVVDTESDTVKVSGAVLTKELSTALAAAGRCTTLGNGNTVGVIPYAIGGGTSFLTGVLGSASDQILSATLITATGTLVHTNSSTLPDLLWAIKGAGQFFGVVLEIAMKTYPLSILGTPTGAHWMGNFIFPVSRAGEVCEVMKLVMGEKKYNTAGILMITAPPPLFQPVLIVAPHLTGAAPDIAERVFKPLYDLEPVHVSSSTPLFPNYADGLDYACQKGEYKSFRLAGVREFDEGGFVDVVGIFEELRRVCPDAAGGSGFAFEWHSRTKEVEVEMVDSAWSFGDVLLWLNTFSWYKDPTNHSLVRSFEDRVLSAMRRGQTEDQYIDYPNCEREGPVERRYRGQERLSKLRELKGVWDPMGVFTREFLD